MRVLEGLIADCRRVDCVSTETGVSEAPARQKKYHHIIVETLLK